MERDYQIEATELTLTDEELEAVCGGIVVVPIAYVAYGILAGGAAGITGAAIGAWLAR